MWKRSLLQMAQALLLRLRADDHKLASTYAFLPLLIPVAAIVDLEERSP
jgi:hypothetical protein